MEPGTYRAKVKNYGITETPKGEKQAQVTFSLIDIGRDYSWYCAIASDEQQEIVVKNLYTLGANSGNIDRFEEGVQSGILDTSKMFDVVVVNEQYKGKTYTKIKWINDPNVQRASAIFVKNSGVSLKGIAKRLEATGQVAAKNDSDIPF